MRKYKTAVENNIFLPQDRYCQAKTCPKRRHLQAHVRSCFPERSPREGRLAPQPTEVAAIFPLAEPSPSAPIRGIRPSRAHPGRPAPCRPVMLAQLFLPLAGLALLQRPPAAIVWCRRSPSESPPCEAV